LEDHPSCLTISISEDNRHTDCRHHGREDVPHVTPVDHAGSSGDSLGFGRGNARFVEEVQPLPPICLACGTRIRIWLEDGRRPGRVVPVWITSTSFARQVDPMAVRPSPERTTRQLTSSGPRISCGSPPTCRATDPGGTRLSGLKRLRGAALV